MAVRVKLNDESLVIAHVTFAEMHKAYKQALDRKTTLDVKDDDGTVTRAVSPFQIVYFEEIDDETAAELVNGARRRDSTPA